MKQQLLKKSIFIIALSFVSIQLNAQVFDFDTDENGWTAGNNTTSLIQVESEGANGAVELIREGDNALINLNGITIDATAQNYLKIVYKNNSKSNQLRLKATGGVNDNTLQWNIAAETGDYVTEYYELNTAAWDSTTEGIQILFRRLYEVGEGSIFIDEIEFLSYTSGSSNSEWIKDPGFDDDLIGLINWTENDADGSSRNFSITQSFIESFQGPSSCQVKFSGVPTIPTGFLTNVNEEDYGMLYNSASTFQYKVWVKTNKTETFNIIGRVILTDDITDPANPITYNRNAEVTTTQIDGSWEQLTFDISLENGDVFNKVKGAFLIPEMIDNYDTGDALYLDEIEASSVLTTETLSVDNNSLENISVYPNPALDVLNINSVQTVDVSLYNILGKLVMSEKAISGEYQLNVSALSAGVYLVRLSSQGKLVTKKLIIE